VPLTTVKLDGNFNDIIGAEYEINNFESSDKLEKTKLYVGSTRTLYLAYEEASQDVVYKNTTQRNTGKSSKKFTLYDILSFSKSEFKSTNTETFARDLNDGNGEQNITAQVFRKNQYDIVSLSTENLYQSIKEDCYEGNDYFYGVAISQNFTPNFRMYGLMIASYEHHDYHKGEAYFFSEDENGTSVRTTVKNDSDDDHNKLIAVDGRFKGMGFGYKLTAELHYQNLSFFITGYTKKTTLDNYHTGIKNYVKPTDDSADDGFPSQVIRKKTITYKEEYLTFGLKYRF
jgi:hypothetical protein